MRRLLLLSLLLTSVSLPAMAASSPDELKSRLAAARQEAVENPALDAAPQNNSMPIAAAPTGNRQVLAELHADQGLPPGPPVLAPDKYDPLIFDKPPVLDAPAAAPPVPSPTGGKAIMAKNNPPATAPANRELPPAKITGAASGTEMMLPPLNHGHALQDTGLNGPKSVAAVLPPSAAPAVVTKEAIPLPQVMPQTTPGNKSVAELAGLDDAALNVPRIKAAQPAPTMAMGGRKDITPLPQTMPVPVVRNEPVQTAPLPMEKMADKQLEGSKPVATAEQKSSPEEKTFIKQAAPKKTASADHELVPVPQVMPPLPRAEQFDTVKAAPPAMPARRAMAPGHEQMSVYTPPAPRLMAQNIPLTPIVVPAAMAKGQWQTRSINAASNNPNDVFCLIENKFDNNVSIMIGQRADGYSTLGLNYGIDMLSPNKQYQVDVKVDNGFDESFMGYAESGHTLIVQLGKKASFFNMLPAAHNIVVAIPGSATNIAAQGIAGNLNNFSDCLQKIGGTDPMAAATSAVMAPVAPPIAPDMTPVPAAVPVTSQDMPLPTPVSAAPVAAVATASKAPVLTPAKPPWSAKVLTTLKQASITPMAVQENSSVTEWTDAGGQIHGQAWRVQGSDLVDAAMFEIDRAEKNCKGSFSSQIGAPEDKVGISTLAMESSCTSTDSATASAWLLQQSDGDLTAWEMQAPSAQRQTAIQARAQVLSTLQNNASAKAR